MAFEPYYPRAGGGSKNPLTDSRFAFCWLSASKAAVPSHLTFNHAALEMLGEGTTHISLMWDRAERVFAIIPTFPGDRGALKLARNDKDTDGLRRVSANGMCKEFPELSALRGQAWRILSDPALPYFVTRFASRKEMSAGD